MPERTEHPKLTRDWLQVLSLSNHERQVILGSDVEERPDRQASFNTLAEFLRHEVGLPDDDIAEWLRSGMASWDLERPLDKLSARGGFDDVWELAVKVADEVREDLADTGPPEAEAKRA